MRTPTKLRREAHRCMTTRIERILFFVPVAIVTASILVIIATHVSSPAPVQISVSQRSQIAIVTVMNSSSNLYKTALDSMKCYAYQNDYKFIMVNNTAYHKICPQRDFFFQRHCIVAHLLAESNYSWILLVDTDIGVVNENRTIEEYIRDDADIIFYDRFFNFEVMAGSYLVKKSEYGIKFLRGWANFESRLPKVFSGSDNGAIHMYLAEIASPKHRLIPRCWKLWNDTVNFETLTRFTLCCREAMKNDLPRKVFIYGKGKGWARDAWLSNSHWSPVNDFMFHALKEKYRKEITEGQEEESTNGKGWARDAWLSNSHWSPVNDFMFHALKEKYRKDISEGEKKTLGSAPYFPWMHTLHTPLDLEKCRKNGQRAGQLSSPSSLRKPAAFASSQIRHGNRFRKVMSILALDFSKAALAVLGTA
ncbi:hypothetical protein Q1695_007691 [Nippostrongylus brasiliensis]|nr:hypothetical protein Q1695_007691 [Nippostrongylus brasiliensis]